ncbi:MAG: TonB family protein [Alphaproteobacteria bacterium]|nr:TonB family protein [Alphaproteobacteria bacterium]MBU1512670.1 TonB family protein [Alphaproteobacteria bacterium]MBU2095064.1 TonB family protein [Alphaproteobacteria bacterium]MBU2151817.1 TonB family protein [Alphaproteobacteria bacterium]MBU2306216.1 TonB family protein [Alphaproteobacteria bacterium]
MHSRLLGLVLVIGAAATTQAGAASEPKGAPDGWVSFPTRTDFAAAEAGVRNTGTFARAVARCHVADDGALTDCRIVRETPLNSGFGEALLALVPKYRRAPPGADSAREIMITTSWAPFDKPGDWVKIPTPARLLEVFPADAYKRGISGRALISCVATVQGALADCVTLDETPAGMGFGGAAIALTPQFLMKPATLAGKPVGSVMNVPVNFKMGGGGRFPVGDGKKVFPANVAWSAAPTFAEVAAAYPAKARAERKGGRVALTCDMTGAGRLTDCQVATSDPFGYGFDTAAKALARQFTYPIASEKDRKAARELTVHLPITFDPTTLDEATPVVGKPTWTVIPNDGQITAAFANVKAAGTVRVTLSCKVQPAGTVDGCTVASETPTGAGVGAAALTLATTFRLSTWSSEGLPVVGGTVRIPLRYEPAPAVSTTPASPPPAGH